MIVNSYANLIPIRIYSPEHQICNLPVLVYYHGGGYVFGKTGNYKIFFKNEELYYLNFHLDHYDGFLRFLVDKLHLVVVSIE